MFVMANVLDIAVKMFVYKHSDLVYEEWQKEEKKKSKLSVALSWKPYGLHFWVSLC